MVQVPPIQFKEKTHPGIPYPQTYSKDVHWKGNENSSGNNEWSWTNWKSAGSSPWNKDNSYNQEERGTKVQPDYDPKSTSSSSWNKDKSFCQETWD